MNLFHLSFALILISAPQGDGRVGNRIRTPVRWPDTGLTECQKLVDINTRNACKQCFTDAGNNLQKIKACVKQWLPTTIAKCATKTYFNHCVRRSIIEQYHINKKANKLYNVGLPWIMKVVHSKILEDGPAAIMSSMAQEVLMSSQAIKDSIKDVNHNCSERFKVDKQNAQWHLTNSKKGKNRDGNSSERTLVYQYGLMGHDMPFHGVGPLAVDILKGKCILKHVRDSGKLQNFAYAALDNPHPMPAWIFQEMVQNVNSIKLP